MQTLILKATNGCNLDCKYCSLGKKNNPIMLDKSLCYESIAYACNVCKNDKSDSLNIILHGGEPTILDMKIYEFAIDKAREDFPEIKISVAMQSNAYYVDDFIIEFCKKYHIVVGISLDGDKNTHDDVRLTKNGKPTFDMIEKNIQRYMSNGIRVNGLVVLTSSVIDSGFEYLKFFEKYDMHLKVNPLLNYGNALDNDYLYLKPKQYANYLIELFEYVVKNPSFITISPIDKIVNAVIKGTHVKQCTFSPDCNNNFLCIDYLGDIFPCGKYADLKDFCLGNVKDKNYNVHNHPVLNEIKKRKGVDLPKKCKECLYLKYCNSGCNAECHIDSSNVPLLCDDYMTLFDYFTGEGLLLIKDTLIKYKDDILKKGVVN